MRFLNISANANARDAVTLVETNVDARENKKKKKIDDHWLDEILYIIYLCRKKNYSTFLLLLNVPKFYEIKDIEDIPTFF